MKKKRDNLEIKDIGSVEKGVIWRKEDQQKIADYFHEINN